MSVDATIWAWTQTPKKQSEKFVLLALADRAGEDDTCWPSITRLVADTMLNEKTINAALKSLVEQGLIADTGRRVGETRRVKVYRLLNVSHRENKSGHSGNNQNNTTDNGGVSESTQNGGDSSNEIPPKTDSNTTKNGFEYPQKRGSEPTSEPINEPNTFLESDQSSPKAKRAKPISSDFSITNEMACWFDKRIASELQGLGVNLSIELETEKFVNHWLANGQSKKDWVAAWRNWLLNALSYAAKRPTTQGSINGGQHHATRKLSAAERAIADANELLSQPATSQYADGGYQEVLGEYLGGDE